MKTVNDYTRKEFKKLPLLEANSKVKPFRRLVIIPTKRKHDSGYRIMNFVIIGENDVPIGRIETCSDVICIDYYNRDNEINNWKIDCLPKSGLLCLFCNRLITIDSWYSDFCIKASWHENL